MQMLNQIRWILVSYFTRPWVLVCIVLGLYFLNASYYESQTSIIAIYSTFVLSIAISMQLVSAFRGPTVRLAPGFAFTHGVVAGTLLILVVAMTASLRMNTGSTGISAISYAAALVGFVCAAGITWGSGGSAQTRPLEGRSADVALLVLGHVLVIPAWLGYSGLVSVAERPVMIAFWIAAAIASLFILKRNLAQIAFDDGGPGFQKPHPRQLTEPRARKVTDRMARNFDRRAEILCDRGTEASLPESSAGAWAPRCSEDFDSPPVYSRSLAQLFYCCLQRSAHRSTLVLFLDSRE